MVNKTLESGLVRRLTSLDVEAIAAEDRSQIRNYAIVVTKAVAFSQGNDELDIFTARSRKEREQWWKFWETKKNDTTYIYYLVDLRDRHEPFPTTQVALDNTYPLAITVSIDYCVEDARQVALGVDDALGRLIKHITETVRKFVLGQNDLVGLHDIELSLDGHLKQNEIQFFDRLGIRVFDINAEVSLPHEYYDDLHAHIEEEKRKERERRERERKLKEDEELANEEVKRKEIESQKELDLADIEANTAEEMTQSFRRLTQAQIRRAKDEEELQRALDDLKLTQDKRKLLGVRAIRIEEQRTEEILTLQAALAANNLLMTNTQSAMRILEEIGLDRKQYRWIVFAVVARMLKDPSEGFAALYDMTSKILEDNRNSAKEALSQFYEVTRPAVEAGFVSTNELKQVAQMLIPALTGSDIDSFFQTKPALEQGEEDRVTPVDYTGPSVEDYDNYQTPEDADMEDTLNDIEEFEPTDLSKTQIGIDTSPLEDATEAPWQSHQEPKADNGDTTLGDTPEEKAVENQVGSSHETSDDTPNFEFVDRNGRQPSVEENPDYLPTEDATEGAWQSRQEPDAGNGGATELDEMLNEGASPESSTVDFPDESLTESSEDHRNL